MNDLELKPGSSLQAKQGPSGDIAQRTEQWFEDRKGRFTGSKNKLLMKCGRAGAKLGWGDPAKLIDFSVAAEKYIYNVGKERTTGHRSMEITNKILSYGKDSEPLLVKQLLKDGLITDFEDCDFITFKGNEWGGASPDGRATYKSERVGMETKCTVSWDGHFARMYEEVDDQHDDFWQFQSEMLAMEVDKLLYVVASPMTTEHYEYKMIHASPIHQAQLLKRIEIANMAIDNWAQHNYQDSLSLACANYTDI